MYQVPLNKYVSHLQMGHVKQKSAFEYAQYAQTDSDNPAHAQSIIRSFALHSFSL